MRGRRIPHPLSTHFHEANDNLPSSKRIKTQEYAESDDGSLHDGVDLQTRNNSPRSFRNEIPDSEDEEESDVELSHDHRQTELETALPPIKTDKEAIAEYEAMRAAELESSDLKERLSSRTWTKGRSSIYVDAFNLALETVLEDEAHLFDEAEAEVFKQWKSLDYEAQYLYVRLFLRKTSTWHRLTNLAYYGDISDLSSAVQALQCQRDLPDTQEEQPGFPGDFDTPSDTCTLGLSFTFADASEAEITTLEEASSLLKLDELKAFAKDAKVQGKNKAQLLKGLQDAGKRQSGIKWSLKRSDSKNSITSNDSSGEKESLGILKTEDSAKDETFVEGKNRSNYFLQKILASTGPCIRLSLPTLKLFERVHLVFYRSTEWTDKSLSTIILARISRRVFPEYIVSRSANIFESRSLLREFEASIRLQFRVDNILEFNGPPSNESLKEILSIFEEVYPRWQCLIQEEQKKEDRVYESGEGAYLRRFSPAHVYTRIIHKATTVMGKFKEYDREHEVLSELLDQRLFHAARRGLWHQRKALLEEHYMWALRSGSGTVERQKTVWKRKALNTCEAALQDRDCHIISHYDLQKRVRKLEKGLKLTKREQHDFGHVSLAKPAERFVEGIQVLSEPDRPTHAKGQGQKSTKTIWIDERDGGGECSVEDMCLSYYRDQGYRGYHCEGGIIRTLFAYLFFDILFVYIPNVFQTAYQTCPLDLHTDSFYPSRLSEINRRLVEIGNGEAPRLISEVDAREREKKTCVVGLNWDFALDDLLEIASCFEGHALATICQVMAQEYRARGGGIPDLFLWNLQRKEVLFSEVKSENDRLSDTQRLWIHVLTGAGIKVELCHTVAREVRQKEK